MKLILSFWFVMIGFSMANAQCDNVEITNDISNKPYITILNPGLENMSSLDYKKNFGIYRLRNNIKSNISVTCRYEMDDKGRLKFWPISDLSNDLEFVIQTIIDRDTCRLNYYTPKSEKLDLSDKTIGFEMFPKTDSIPLNILCFHICFDETMDPKKDAYQYIEVFDENDSKIPTMWRNKTYWLKNKTIMVLMVHPARVKRGIDLDIPFLEGKKYVIKLKDGLFSKSGVKIPGKILKTFTAVKPDYIEPKLLKFDGKIPFSNSRNSLKFSFNEGMDYSSIRDGVIFRIGDKKINGRINILRNDSEFEFIPNENWKEGNYEIVLQKIVSDFSSNRLNSPFEEKLDVQYPNKEQSVVKRITIE